MIEGRIWWCECGRPWPWITDVWTRHCSQHLADPYSITHVSHGMILYGLLAWLLPRWDLRWRLWIAVGVAGAWEVLENSPPIIERYRTATMSLDYMGDSIVNSLGDTIACGLGFFLARRLGLVRTAAVFLSSEVILLMMMRDNLILNVLMLIYPVEAIKDWHSFGHA